MKGLLKRKSSYLWCLVPIVVLLEIVLQWWIPARDPSDAEWKAAVRVVREEKQKGDLVVIAPEWAVQGRMYFNEFIGFKEFGRFDTTLYKRILEVSIGDARSPETDGMNPEHSMTFGNLTVSRYNLPEPAEVLYSFVDKWRDAEYEETARQRPKLVIDHWFHPRRVLQVSLRRKASVSYEGVPLGGVLRGYAVIGYREGRFNKGGPIRLTVFLDEKKIGEKMVANFSPIEPFEFNLPGTGTGTVRFEVYAKDNKKREFGFTADVRSGGVK